VTPDSDLNDTEYLRKHADGAHALVYASVVGDVRTVCCHLSYYCNPLWMMKFTYDHSAASVDSWNTVLVKCLDILRNRRYFDV